MKKRDPGMQTVIQVDAFTSVPFRGNPAAVCVMDAPAAPDWMQNVAREMNLSETAFLHPEEEGYRLRWFTPACEVTLCGHATLASAHVLWTEGHLPPDREARFQTQSGPLIARRDGDWIEMDFPAIPSEPAALTAPQLAALALRPLHQACNRTGHLLELATEDEVRGYQPDAAIIRRHCQNLVLTSRAQAGEYDFVSRYFAPGFGVDEDPVTGSTHCALGVYWRERLGKERFVAYQASARGGVVGVRVDGERVILRGQAVTVLRGELV